MKIHPIIQRLRRSFRLTKETKDKFNEIKISLNLDNADTLYFIIMNFLSKNKKKEYISKLILLKMLSKKKVELTNKNIRFMNTTLKKININNFPKNSNAEFSVFINRKPYKNVSSIKNVVNYILNTKNENSTEVLGYDEFGLGCNTQLPIKEYANLVISNMINIRNVYARKGEQKSRKIYQCVISFKNDFPKVAALNYIARYITEKLGTIGYISVYSIHKQSKYHIHLVFLARNYITRKQFHGDLHDFEHNIKCWVENAIQGFISQHGQFEREFIPEYMLEDY